MCIRDSACTWFHVYSVEYGATNPTFLWSTNLRKHFASMCILENLQDNELDVVAGFMGHDIEIHHEFFRLPQNTLQVVKMGRLLTAKELGINLEAKDVVVKEFIEVDENAVSHEDSDDVEAG